MTEYMRIIPVGPRRHTGRLVAVYVLVCVASFVAGFAWVAMRR